jgi:hypothetical protein
VTAPLAPEGPGEDDDDRSTWRSFIGCTLAMLIAAVLATAVVWLAW